MKSFVLKIICFCLAFFMYIPIKLIDNNIIKIILLVIQILALIIYIYLMISKEE